MTQTPMVQPAPRVFVSHASEDKERFVLGFAERLRAGGIDAWVDSWEMLPGDSLADKIFQEGIGLAAAVIVVLSQYSVEKKWVREEINAGFVKRVNEGTILIPVLIDNCAVPGCLKSTVWVRINDLDEYDDQFKKVVAAVFGIRQKPPIGTPPRYVEAAPAVIAGLTMIDMHVFIALGHASLGAGGYGGHATEPIWENLKKQGVSREDFLVALDVLESMGFVRPSSEMSPSPLALWLTLGGFEEYARARVPAYAEVRQSVIADILNHNPSNSIQITDRISQPQFLVEHVLRVLANESLIEIAEPLAPLIFITGVTPRLRRLR